MGAPQWDTADFELTPWNGGVVYAEHSFIAGTQAWLVREVLDATTASRVLIFARPGVARRVRSYPSNWRELSSDALLTLSWSK